MEPTTQPTFGPYSPVRQAGGFYFISGQIGVNPTTKTPVEGVREQTAQALENLKAVLAGAGLTTNHVVKTTIFLANMGDFAVVNEVYEAAFAEPRPARSTVAVAELPRVAGASPIKIKVEIEAVAYAAASQG